jgi:hypothetical protein
MPYASDRDRNPHMSEIEEAPWPAPPLNLFLTSGYQPGVFDLVWDDPAGLALNARFVICGINLYRSFDSEFGPYNRITHLPVGATFWRDQTDNVVVVDEIVTDDQWVLRGHCSASGTDAPKYVFKTQHKPIVKAESQKVPTTSPGDVIIQIDGVRARVLRVNGEAGEVEIDPYRYANVSTQNYDEAIVPTEESTVTVGYRYTRDLVRTDLSQRVFYRATTVGLPIDFPVDKPQGSCIAGSLRETPLARAAFTSSFEIEKIDYIWREAVRRNQWILFQGGERVKLFIRKRMGPPCPCVQHVASSNQPTNDCPNCFGTGIMGGYEGPYDTIIAPDDAERRTAQRDLGRTVEHVYEVWTGPSPLLSQRDFLVKINGERYSVGAVRMPTNRGMVLQQHFQIGHLDEKDIRYSVPMDNSHLYTVDRVSPVIPPGTEPAQITDKPNIPNEREIRGRNVVWEGIVY